MLTETEKTNTKALIENAAKDTFSVLRSIESRFPKGSPEWEEDMEELLTLAEQEFAKYREELDSLLPEEMASAIPSDV
jgi:hypothetical protein